MSSSDGAMTTTSSATSATLAPAAAAAAPKNPAASTGSAPGASTPMTKRRAATKTSAKVAPKSLGRYQFGDELGGGTYGKVFRGLNVTTGEVVAMKQIDKTKLGDKLALVMKELEWLQKLEHPNLVKFIEFQEQDDFLYFIVEIVEGGSLHSAMKKFGVFPESLLNIYVTQALRGLQYLHDNDVIHRDIKGANILVNKEGQCKLVDFGKGLHEATDLLEDKEAAPYWMAPELIRWIDDPERATWKLTPKTDIWALGCTIMELLTGSPPYYEQGPVEARKLILERDHPPLPTHVSENLRAFLETCFAKEPDARPTARELLNSKWITKIWAREETSASSAAAAAAEKRDDRSKSDNLDKEGMQATISALAEKLSKEADEKQRLQSSVEHLNGRLEKLNSEKEKLQSNLKDLKARANAEQRAMIDELKELIARFSPDGRVVVATPQRDTGDAAAAAAGGGGAGGGSSMLTSSSASSASSASVSSASSSASASSSSSSSSSSASTTSSSSSSSSSSSGAAEAGGGNDPGSSASAGGTGAAGESGDGGNALAWIVAGTHCLLKSSIDDSSEDIVVMSVDSAQGTAHVVMVGTCTERNVPLSFIARHDDTKTKKKDKKGGVFSFMKK